MITFTLTSISLLFTLTRAQQQWAPCSLYCFPRDSQSSSELQQAGYCPPATYFYSFSDTYYTQTCTCYDYYLTDGSSWSNCYTCGPASNSFEETCYPEPAQDKPVADASCSSKSDGISEACNIGGDISKAVDVLCDVSGALGLSGKAKGIFAGLRFLVPPLARSALTVVDAGCKLWGKGGDEATKLITSGCSTWNEIGGCPAEDAVTGGGSGSSSSVKKSDSSRMSTNPVGWLIAPAVGSLLALV